MPLVTEMAGTCATYISGHIQRIQGGTSVAWVFLARTDAFWEASRSRAFRAEQIAQPRASRPAAEAAASGGEENRNYEQGNLYAQERTRESTRGTQDEAIRSLRDFEQ